MSDVFIVKLPRLYENMDEATLGMWRVAPGMAVKVGEPLVELITDKTVIDYEAPCTGTLLGIYADTKSTVPFGYALCAIGEAGAALPNVAAENEALLRRHLEENSLSVSLDAPKKAEKEAPPKPVYKAAPAAKAFAKEKKISLDEVALFCGRPMIHRKDVEEYLASMETKAQPVAEVAAAPVVQEASAHAVAPAIEQRVALVTGASGAIGSAITRRLAQNGIAVCIHCNHASGNAEKLAAELTAAGATCAVFPADLTIPSAAKELVDAVMARFGRLDILVNNAGCLQDATLPFMSDQQWNEVMELNLNAPFRLIRAAAMIMAHGHWGRIVNMSSAAGLLGSANRANYAAAKEGLLGLTRSAARELAGLGIRVNAVAPGFVESPMTEPIQDKKRQEIIRSIPVKRFGKPDEVAAVVAFLSSQDADYITGQCLSVNGGLVM